MNRVFLDLGFIQIYWYSLLIALGLFVGIIIILKEAKRQKISEDFFVNLIFYGTIFAIIGARLYYVLFNWSYYSNHFVEIFEIWNGGMAIHGSMLAGGLFVIYYCMKSKVRFLKVIDIIVVGLIIGQAIGMKIGANYYHPTFLYESIWNLLGFIILLIARRFKYIHVGQITAIYMMWYGLGRFIIEGFRTDSLMLGSFRMAQIVSICMFVVGLVLFIIKFRMSRFDDRYNKEIVSEVNN